MIKIVSVREVHIQKVRIEADTDEEAIAKVKDGEGEFDDNDLSYSHCLDSDTWTVEDS